jgi:hypothetical protein
MEISRGPLGQRKVGWRSMGTLNMSNFRRKNSITYRAIPCFLYGAALVLVWANPARAAITAFLSGTSISSTAVNANFSNLDTRVSALEAPGGIKKVYVLTGNGTVYVPSGATAVLVEAYGGGGGGCGGGSSNTGGNGGSALGVKGYFSVTAGDAINVTIDPGGIGGGPAGCNTSAGIAGGTTTVTGATPWTLTAAGGTGGLAVSSCINGLSGSAAGAMPSTGGFGVGGAGGIVNTIGSTGAYGAAILFFL